MDEGRGRKIKGGGSWELRKKENRETRRITVISQGRSFVRPTVPNQVLPGCAILVRGAVLGHLEDGRVKLTEFMKMDKA